MQIEYEQTYREIWVAKIGDKELCVIHVVNGDATPEVHAKERGADGFMLIPLPGSPFESLNKAKAVIEYHYRHLL